MRTLVLALVIALALPAGAAAHSTIIIQSSDVLYTSEDAISKNRLTIDESATEIHFYDPQADAGFAVDARCRTAGGRMDPSGQYPVEAWCPKTGLRNLTIDLGPNEDAAAVTLSAIATGGTGGTGTDDIKVNGPTADLLAGDQGSDRLDAGDGADDLRGDDGNDTLIGGGGNDAIQGGAGTDAIDGGEGDDTINSPDGLADRVACGGGTDTVRADTVDEVGADCENVQRSFVAPPADQPAADDKTRPTLQVGGSTSQRVSSRRRTIRIAATLDETGVISAAGFLDAGGINTQLKSKNYPVTVAGGGVTITIKLSRRQWRLVSRDLRRRRRVVARIDVVGTDQAGNATVVRRFKIRLRR